MTSTQITIVFIFSVFLAIQTDAQGEDSAFMKPRLNSFTKQKVTTQAPYGKVTSFIDVYGKQWDLIEPNKENK